jgi:putative transposase
MILTYKIKHNNDFTKQLSQARKIAKFAIKNKNKLSSKYVAHIGLNSGISNQILRKYGRNKNIKKVSKIKLIVPNQIIKLKENTIYIPSLKVSFEYTEHIKIPFLNINQIEIDNHYYYVAVEIQEEQPIISQGYIGIDRNTTGHCAVVANTKTSKVKLLGKKAIHIHTKYSKIRKHLQIQKKYKKLKTIRKRESNIVKDLNHKISREIVNEAKETNCSIKLEYLKGIRNNKKQQESFHYALNSWSYYQLQLFIEYKAKLLGIPVLYIEPAYTSQTCHKCGQIGIRNGKSFKCPHCGYTAHADVNAAWNVAYSEQLLVEPQPEHLSQSGSLPEQGNVYSQRFSREGDLEKGNTDIPLLATALSAAGQKTLNKLV